MSAAPRKPEAGVRVARATKERKARWCRRIRTSTKMPMGKSAHFQRKGKRLLRMASCSLRAAVTDTIPQHWKIGFIRRACGLAAKKKALAAMRSASCKSCTTLSSTGSAGCWGSHAGARMRTEPSPMSR